MARRKPYTATVNGTEPDDLRKMAIEQMLPEQEARAELANTPVDTPPSRGPVLGKGSLWRALFG